MVVDQMNAPPPPVIKCQAPLSRVYAAVRGAPPVTATLNWNSVAVVPPVGDTLPV
jgi:hypothetical protein